MWYNTLMINYSNSLKYDMHGRKRKMAKQSLSTPKKRRNDVEGINPIPDYSRGSMDAHREKYPSAPMGSIKPAPGRDTSYKIEVSSKYTVAVAYNKGAYQVISRDDVKNIGK